MLPKDEPASLDPPWLVRTSILRKMVAASDLLAKALGVGGLLVALASFGYTVYRDRRAEPDIELTVTPARVWNVGGGDWVELTVLARNRGTQDIGVESVGFADVAEEASSGVRYFYLHASNDEDTETWSLNERGRYVDATRWNGKLSRACVQGARHPHGTAQGPSDSWRRKDH